MVPLSESNILSKSVIYVNHFNINFGTSNVSNDFIYLQGGLRISLFPLIRSYIFSLVVFLVCFFLTTVAFEAE